MILTGIDHRPVACQSGSVHFEHTKTVIVVIQSNILRCVMLHLVQWFLTLLEVLNPASFISAFTETFVIRKIKYDFFKT